MILKKATQVGLTLCLLLMVAAVAVPNAQEKQYKDRAEYDIITKVYGEADPGKRIALLNEWSQKYEETDYHLERTQFYLASYQATNQHALAVEAAKELLGKVPGNFTANLVITQFSPYLGRADDEIIADGTRAATELLKTVPQQFATKPDTIAQEAWDTARTQALAAAHLTIGWGQMQKKENVAAEQSFRKVLEIDPSRGQVSYWLGQVVLGQNDAEKYDVAFFSFARAAIYDGPNSMPQAGRQQVAEYVQNMLRKNYGEKSFELYWPQFEEMAKAGALPSARIELKSDDQLQFEAEQKSRRELPLLWVYKDLKSALTGAQGTATWSRLNGAMSPKMALYVVSATPPERPGTINLTSEPGGSTEVVLNLENRMRTGLRSGRLLTIEGVAEGLTRSPFRLTLNDGRTF